MMEQVQKENRSTTTFTKEFWKEIRVKFYMKTKKNYELKQFQNKFNQLRKCYRVFTDLKKLPTKFGWDPVLKTAIASNAI